VHFAVQALDFAMGVQYRGSVVIQACGPALKQRRNDDNLEFSRQLAQRRGGGAGNGLG
jgi:hypothetical protein